MSSASSVQRDLDRFYKSMDKSDFSIRKVTKGAFTQARAKLNPEAFKRLNQVAIDTFYEQNLVYTWHKMRTIVASKKILELISLDIKPIKNVLLLVHLYFMMFLI
jgi:hypothetical protein